MEMLEVGQLLTESIQDFIADLQTDFNHLKKSSNDEELRAQLFLKATDLREITRIMNKNLEMINSYGQQILPEIYKLYPETLPKDK